MINGKKHTPGSNTLKKMKRKAAMEAAAKKATADKPKAKKAKTKAPKPRARGDRPETVKESPIPKGNSSSPVGKPSTYGKTRSVSSGKPKAKPSTAVADAKVKADAAREKVLKKSKGSAADIAYAKRIRGI
jgi:hypothetical protein